MAGTKTTLEGVGVYNDNNIFAQIYGREYGAWIGSRGGHSSGDLIENPAGMIESLIREEVHCERDLDVEAKQSSTVASIDRPLHKETDYYNGSYFHNVSIATVNQISDFAYDQASVRWNFTSSTFSTTLTNHKGFLTNVNCNIDTDLFDDFETARSGWIFARSYDKRDSVHNILKQLAFESHSILFESCDTSGNPIWKIIPLDSGSSIQTLGTPLYMDGNVQFSAWLSNPKNIFTEYVFNYAFDFGKGDYIGQIFCNKKDSSSGIGSTYENLCQSAETNYRTQQKFIKNLDNIYDPATAKALMSKLIMHLTLQKLCVWGRWELNEAGDLEYGDLVKVNFPSGMPSSFNNSTVMMIKSKKTVFEKKQPYIELAMMELPT